MVNMTVDMLRIATILNHPEVFGFAGDDLSTEPFVPATEHLYVMNDEQTGVVVFKRVNGICADAHIAILPELRGKGRYFAKEVVEWLFANTTYTKILAMVPQFRTEVLKLCEYCGFIREGHIKKAFLKDWQYHDLILLGLTKTDFKGD